MIDFRNTLDGLDHAVLAVGYGRIAGQVDTVVEKFSIDTVDVDVDVDFKVDVDVDDVGVDVGLLVDQEQLVHLLG